MPFCIFIFNFWFRFDMSSKLNIGNLHINTIIDLFFDFAQLTSTDIDEIILVLGLDDLLNVDYIIKREIIHLLLLIIVISVYDINEEDVPSCFKPFYNVYNSIEFYLFV